MIGCERWDNKRRICVCNCAILAEYAITNNVAPSNPLLRLKHTLSMRRSSKVCCLNGLNYNVNILGSSAGPWFSALLLLISAYGCLRAL